MQESDDIEKRAGSDIVSPAETVDGRGSRLTRAATEIRPDDGGINRILRRAMVIEMMAKLTRR
jgi:hypothetical protein